MKLLPYPLPLASNKTFIECNCHLRLHPYVWPRLERPQIGSESREENVGSPLYTDQQKHVKHAYVHIYNSTTTTDFNLPCVVHK